MSKSIASLKVTRTQKICTLWTHDDSFSKGEVVFNPEKFPELSISAGSLIRIIALKPATAVRDFQSSAKSSSRELNQAGIDDGPPPVTVETHSRRSRRQSVVLTLDENGSSIPGGREIDPQKSYVFVTRRMSSEQKSKHPNLQVSIAEKVAKVFGFRNRMQIVVTVADEETHSASHVEIAFRDEYLARADMWRMSIAELSRRTVYRGQKLLFMGTIKATVKNVYINGQSTHSGYFSSNTKPVFRSESARYVLFIQMSKEMWDFDAEGAGEIMFNKVINGFLPELFKRWMKIDARHLVTIILFTRMEYDRQPARTKVIADDKPSDTNNDSEKRPFRDYYRVVVSEMASGDWVNILYQLKKEFRTFLRDVSLVPKVDQDGEENETDLSEKISSEPGYNLTIAGTPSTAANGNMLEAISLAAAQFENDYIDRDLVHTGISMVIITAGTGVFEVDYNTLKLTTDTLVGSGIGIDLVCLSPMPLHSVPLFKYRNPRLVSAKIAKSTIRGGMNGSFDKLDEQDDKTPRQNLPNFGTLASRSPRRVPPIPSISPTATSMERESDEWSYAMPHWVDISFWSGPSEEIVELAKPKKSKKALMKPKAKNKPFNLRCRMYELQMMGIMENELGNISIPYVEELSHYPHGLRELWEDHTSSLDRAGVTDKLANNRERHDDSTSKQGLSLYRSWMETYDEQIFYPLSERRDLNGTHATAGSRWTSNNDHLTLLAEPKNSLLSSSFGTPGSSLGKTARPPPDISFHQLMREHSNEIDNRPGLITHRSGSIIRPNASRLQEETQRLAPSREMVEVSSSVSHRRGGSGDSNLRRVSLQPARKEDSVSIGQASPPKRLAQQPRYPKTVDPPTKTNKTARPTGWLTKQLSFGGLGFSASKSSAGSKITSSNVEATPMTVEHNQKGAIPAKLASTKSLDSEKPSQPIAIRSASRATIALAHSPTSEHAPQSVETVKSMKTVRKPETSQPGSMTKDHGSLFLFAGSKDLLNQVGRKPDLSSSGGAREIPRTLSPTSALSPWLVLVNPCNPRKNNMNIASQFRRWQHIFPKPLRTSSIKWKSLCSPASVPLTNEYFPTAEQLATEYNESPYKIIQDEDDETAEGPKSRESLIRELIAFRLSHGFQIIIGSSVAEFAGRRENDLANIFHTDYMSNDGDTVFMTIGNTIHQLVCVAGGEVEVKRFMRKPTTALQASAGVDSPLPYKPLIRTALEDKYHSRDIVLRPPRKEYNWNYIDTFLAGYHDDFTDILRFWRARFVLIPVDLPTVNRRPLPLLTEDSEEEIRLEGIRKLTQVWQRYRCIPPEERYFQAATRKQKDPNPLAIEYQTRDPSAIVAAGLDSSLLADGDGGDFPTTLFSETDQYQTSNIDVKKLAEDLQGEKGIPVIDRRWHWRLHYNCFVGFDLTSWLLQNFKDIETRDEAVDLGNQLMNKGLFIHVQKKHQFRDGNFFYQIATEYRAPRPDSRTGWFGMRRPDKSVPSTPMSEGPRSSPLTARSNKSRPSTGDSSSASNDGEKTPTRALTPKRSVALSRVMRYDVDPRKRSYRSEIIGLHYDRLHNPDNCYHIRIDWMNVTAKLIEDAIVTWATSVEKYGLKLVEVPIAEASSITNAHPFRSPYMIRLAEQPPKSQPEQFFDSVHFGPQPRTDKFAFHKALLRRLNFVLDIESAASFPADVDVTYSWGRPDYKYTQFIHKSGVLLAQITDEGDFLLLANRLYNNRSTSSRDSTRFKPANPYDRRGGTPTSNPTPAASTPGERANPHRSPFSSPLARPVQDTSLLHSQFQTEKASAATSTSQTAEQIKDEFEAFCSDPVALAQFYEEALKPRASPSPRITPVLDNNIPMLGLPPSITIREASPAPNLGASLMGVQLGPRRQGSDGSGVGLGGS